MKLFSILKEMEGKDLDKFQVFLDTSLYNKREDIPAFITTWRKTNKRSHPKEYYWNLLFPNQAFSSKNWHLLVSRTFKLLETFLALAEIQSSAPTMKYHLAKAYRKNKQEKLFNGTIKDLSVLLDKQAFRSIHYLQQQHDIAQEEYDYIQSLNRKERTNLEEVGERLDAFFIAAKIRQGCNAVSRKMINQENYEIGFLEEVLANIDREPAYLDLPAIAIYYYCYQAITSVDNESFFLKLRAQMELHQQQFPRNEIRDVYFMAINYCIRRLNTGEELYGREALALYRLSLEEGYLLEDGIMPESTFSNIVTLAMKQDDFAWAKAFLNDYKRLLKPGFQEPLFHFSMAKLLYQEKDLEASMQHLSRVETRAPFLFLGARTLQLKIYYQLGEIDVFESTLDSLRVYIQRRKDLGYRKENYENLISFSKKLLQLSVMSKKEKEALRQKVNDAKIFTEKKWFLERI